MTKKFSDGNINIIGQDRKFRDNFGSKNISYNIISHTPFLEHAVRIRLHFSSKNTLLATQAFYYHIFEARVN